MHLSNLIREWLETERQLRQHIYIDDRRMIRNRFDDHLLGMISDETVVVGYLTNPIIYGQSIGLVEINMASPESFEYLRTDLIGVLEKYYNKLSSLGVK